MIGLKPSALNPKQNEQAARWLLCHPPGPHVINTSNAAVMEGGAEGGRKKLVVDQKQAVQSSTFSCLLFALKHLSDNLHTHPPSLSISCVDVWLMFDGTWKKNYFGEDQSLTQVASVGVLFFFFLAKFASAPAC